MVFSKWPTIILQSNVLFPFRRTALANGERFVNYVDEALLCKELLPSKMYFGVKLCPQSGTCVP